MLPCTWVDEPLQGQRIRPFPISLDQPTVLFQAGGSFRSTPCRRLALRWEAGAWRDVFLLLSVGCPIVLRMGPHLSYLSQNARDKPGEGMLHCRRKPLARRKIFTLQAIDDQAGRELVQDTSQRERAGKAKGVR
jgi:hypothetical protein